MPEVSGEQPEMAEQHQGGEAEIPQQTSAIATSSSASVSAHSEITDIHALLVDIKDVLDSFLKELKDLKQHQPCAVDEVSESGKGKEPEISNVVS